MASVSDPIIATPLCLGVQFVEKSCHSLPRGRSSSARRHVAASSVQTYTLRTPPSAHAQPHISRLADDSSMVSSGAGGTMSESGAIDHTRVASPVSRPTPSSTGSLYQRVVNAPSARVSASVNRVSHLTLFVP